MKTKFASLCTFAVALLAIQTGRAADAFLDGFDRFRPAAACVDADGNTYIVGSRDALGAVRKYDVTGLFTTLTNVPLATAVCVGSNNTVYVAGSNAVVRLDRDGQVIPGGYTNTGWTIRGVAYSPGSQLLSASVYVAGVVNSSGRAFVARLNPGLTGSPLTTSLFGYGSGNSAYALAVDNAGDVYVSGHLGSGTSGDFADFSLSQLQGQWKVETANSSGDITSLAGADSTLGGSSVSSRATNYYQYVNFGGAGHFGSDAAFPNGGGDNFAMRASGQIYITTAGNYTFYSSSDDGARLRIDGSNVIVDDSQHGANDVNASATVFLSKGVHSVEYVQFEHGGAESAELSWSVGGRTLVPTIGAGALAGGRAFIFKLAPDLSALKKSFFSTDGSTGDGNYFDLQYIQGWVYAIGYWNGIAQNADILPDLSTANDIEILKLDTGLRLSGRATVKGSDDQSGHRITADNAGNIYFCGNYGADGRVDFIGSDGRTRVSGGSDTPFTSISSAKPGRFVAKLNSSMMFQWVRTPVQTEPGFPLNGGTAPDSVIVWNERNQKVFWSGFFRSGTLTVGDPGTYVSLLGAETAFITAIEPSSAFTERVKLTIISQFGRGGTQVLPFGGTPDIPVTKLLIKGAPISASVPRYIYRDVNDVELINPTADQIANQAQIRYAATGYSLDNGVTTGNTESYSFTLTQDTTLEFRWQIEYALTVDSDLSGTIGASGGGLSSPGSGNPQPQVKKNWIVKDEIVIAQIDGAVLNSDTSVPVRFVPTGYEASGPANTWAAPGDSTTTDFFAFPSIEFRQQVPQFAMRGPAKIVYKWKRQNRVQVNTLSPQAAALTMVKVMDASGQPDGMGTGEFWYDEHTSLEIGAIKRRDLFSLRGWYNGDGAVFSLAGSVSNLNSSFTNNGEIYGSMRVPDLTVPAKVMWDYGERIFEQTVYIGNSVRFDSTTIDDAAILPRIRIDTPPDDNDVTVEADGVGGSTAHDMAEWDAGGKKLFPLRPGQLLVRWHMTDLDPAARVMIRVKIQYPSAPHYRHIANTPGVSLDPDAGDGVSFGTIKYTSAAATVDDSGKFTATQKGKSVLLFYEKTSGRGASVQTYRVRVVETKLLSEEISGPVNAPIGTKITSSYDTAGLDTGYVVDPKSRFNPFIYDREAVKGPIIPVNLSFTGNSEDTITVVWYENRDKINWPYHGVIYSPRWPAESEGLGRIVLASRYGNECVASNGTDQVVAPARVIGTNAIPAEYAFNPSRFQQVQIYNQPDKSIAGYNPNEEHALMAPSLRSAAVSPRPMAAYALRTGDLNVVTHNTSYTSDPFVLVQFLDVLDHEYKMKVYSIEKAATNNAVGDLSYEYSFTQTMDAGEPVIPFYPLVQVIGATPCGGTYGKDGAPLIQKTFWKDHKGTPWAISGDGSFSMFFYYPMLVDFWWPNDAKLPGDCVAWLPSTAGYSSSVFTNIDYNRNDQVPPAQEVVYKTRWPDNLPVLKVGETLTFAGGEYRRDNPFSDILNDNLEFETVETPGLPGVLAWAAGEIVFDTLNPLMDEQKAFSNYTARLYQALEQRVVTLTSSQFPSSLAPATGHTKVKNGKYVFVDLPSSLQRRVFYDPILGKLGVIGLLNDKSIADPTLTAAPPAVYLLEPNVMTLTEYNALIALAPTDGNWTGAVNALYKLSRNPNLLDMGGDGPSTSSENNYFTGLGKADAAYRIGIEQRIQTRADGTQVKQTNASGIVTYARTDSQAAQLKATGPGLAMFANPDFLDPLIRSTNDVSYVTVAENNDDSLGSSPVVLHIIKVDKRQRYRGAIKTILSDNVFDENIILRHTADFGGNADALSFEWWYRAEDGTEAPTPDLTPAPSPWKVFADPSGNRGQGFYQLTLKGNPSAPEALLADTLFYLRYRHTNDAVNGVNWNVAQSNGAPRVPFQWVGSGNSTPQEPQPQLAQGWVKRVLDAVNPYEARIRDFEGDNPATYSSMIRELGRGFEGPVALNPDKNVIENVGLIELYQTILDRARSLSIDLSTPVSTPAIANALQLASTRLLDFYLLLGNEAYSDSVNPLIASDDSDLPPSVFAFENQVATLAEEELALLRGIDRNNGTPVYNRLFWNFTKGEGEAAYALNYNITDVNNDGFIDENDAQILFPQGHGDAWGHYLTAVKMQYDLLNHPYFNWVSRSEFYNLQDIVIPVDFLDERKFAEAAAAKAKAGTEILNLTYRSKFVQNPEAQWQGYSDTDGNRSWGVEEWARRTGQGAYFDWVTANALLPAQHPNTNYSGIQKIDRTTVTEIAVISANLVAVQHKFDEANRGYNPLGLSAGVVSFDIDANFLEVGSGIQGQLHFDQIYNRAQTALVNAGAALDYARGFSASLRNVANTEEDFRTDVYQQDLAYRNQLIEIFGTPYEGAIGSGKAYPAGYEGPDTMLYMYVDVRKVNEQTVPRQTAAYSSNYLHELESGDATFIKGSGVISGVPNSFRLKHAEDFAGSSFTVTQNVNYTDFSNNPRVPLENMNLPITAAGYTFQAPSDWGRRASPGELQSLISQMLQAEADLASSIAAWDSLQGEIVRTLRLLNAQFDMDKNLRDLMKGQIATDTTLDAASLTAKIVAAVNEAVAEFVDGLGDDASDGIPTDTPTGGLAVSVGDGLAPIRAAIEITGKTTAAGFNATKLAFEKLAEAFDFAKSLADAIFDLEKDAVERDFAMKQALTELENKVGDEGVKRVEIFKSVQALRDLSDQYRAKVAEGNRLIAERTAFNKRVAAMAQRHRYQDMSFRVARNAALEKYRSAFDLAARYVYLAAKAYDYETNLDPNDPGSPIDILTDIVRQRSLGLVGDDALDGEGGLSANLAWLKNNFGVLKTQLGINNAQLEVGSFSLRNEAFRTLSGPVSDEVWRQTLKDSRIYKTDLWQVPEFRQYCRPFASESNGPQPGLVIPFATMIRSGKNFFGWPLGGGDTAFDPSIAMTKIASLGIAFASYSGELSSAPRAYLVPVGADIMTVPYSANLDVRAWNVMDQRIPVPYASISSSLHDPSWKPLTDSLSGPLGETRQFSAIRAYPFEGAVDDSSVMFNARLVSRSAWNTRWLLIIPGATLGSDPVDALDTFIYGPHVNPSDPNSPRQGGVSDIRLIINAYGVSGN